MRVLCFHQRYCFFVEKKIKLSPDSTAKVQANHTWSVGQKKNYRPRPIKTSAHCCDGGGDAHKILFSEGDGKVRV